MYDLIIVGAGPAGLGASIYASRYKLNHVVIGAEIGGQVVEAWEIQNYAGIESIAGKDLMALFKKQTESLGGAIVEACVQKVIRIEGGFEVLLENGASRQTKAVIFALGMKPRKLNIPNEDKYLGKGVSYCATCDAMFFRNKDVAVIGGGDAAATAAIHLAEFAKSVKLLYKEGTKCFEPSWEEQIEANPKITMDTFEKLGELSGSERLESMTYEKTEGEEKEMEIEGVFIEIGSTPGVVIAKELGVATDEQGYIVVGQDQSTNVENVYAAGDVTTGSNKFRQIITSVAEGAVASGSVYKKLKLTKKA